MYFLIYIFLIIIGLNEFIVINDEFLILLCFVSFISFVFIFLKSNIVSTLIDRPNSIKLEFLQKIEDILPFKLKDSTFNYLTSDLAKIAYLAQYNFFYNSIRFCHLFIYNFFVDDIQASVYNIESVSLQELLFTKSKNISLFLKLR